MELGFAGNPSQVAHQRPADSLALVRVDHRECDLGLAGLIDDVASAADDHGLAAFLDHGDQGDVTDEVHVHEVGDFLVEKCRFKPKKRR